MDLDFQPRLMKINIESHWFLTFFYYCSLQRRLWEGPIIYNNYLPTIKYRSTAFFHVKWHLCSVFESSSLAYEKWVVLQVLPRKCKVNKTVLLRPCDSRVSWSLVMPPIKSHLQKVSQIIRGMCRAQSSPGSIYNEILSHELKIDFHKVLYECWRVSQPRS